MSILVVGSANADHVFRGPRLPLPGETVLGDSFAIFPGGKGANQAVAAGRLGADVSFVGSMGQDADGDMLLAGLQEAGVDTRFVWRRAEPTGAAGIFVDENGRNMIVAAPGANALVTAEEVETALRSAQPEWVLCQLEVPMPAMVAASTGPKFVLNPAPARAVPEEVLSRCFAIVPNETELEALTGIAPTDEASCRAGAAKLLEKGVENVIVTLGERGAQWVWNGGSRIYGAPSVKAIDTTAAGDVFCGALVSFLSFGRQMDEAIHWANRAAALSTTRLGAQSSAPTREEVERFW